MENHLLFDQCAELYHLLCIHNLEASFYSRYNSFLSDGKARYNLEVCPRYLDCVEGEEIKDIGLSLRFLLYADRIASAPRKIVGASEMEPLNAAFRDKTLVFYAPNRPSRKRRKELQYLNFLFDNLLFVHVASFANNGQSPVVHFYNCGFDNEDVNAVDVVFLPFPYEEGFGERLEKSYCEGCVWLDSDIGGGSEKLYLSRTDDAVSYFDDIPNPLIVFGPELVGSMRIDEDVDYYLKCEEIKHE